MEQFKKILNTLCMWGIVINVFVFGFATFENLTSLQILSIVNILLLLVHFIRPQ